MWLPFICLAIGAILAGVLKPVANKLMQYSLYLLLLGLGAGIGADQRLLSAIPSLGIKALIICIAASVLSVLAIVLWEGLCFPDQVPDPREGDDQCQRAFQHEYTFIISVVILLCLGIGAGHFFPIPDKVLSWEINIALVVIYLSVGTGLKEGAAGLHSNPRLAAYVFVPLIILAASLVGGWLAALLIHVDGWPAAAVGGGVGYYSLTAAMVTQKAGAELGFIAFMTNFLREVLTFFLTPVLARISNLAPVALGGATTMDTTLAVMKRCLGEEYAILAFVSGAVLTFVVPFLLMIVLSI